MLTKQSANIGSAYPSQQKHNSTRRKRRRGTTRTLKMTTRALKGFKFDRGFLFGSNSFPCYIDKKRFAIAKANFGTNSFKGSKLIKTIKFKKSTFYFFTIFLILFFPLKNLISQKFKIKFMLIFFRHQGFHYCSRLLYFSLGKTK